MAEVIDHWPGSRTAAPATFEYPWEQWADLDENGHGDIWLCSRGVDFPGRMTTAAFRTHLYNRANRMTKNRAKNAPLKVMRVRGTDKVRRVPDFKVLKVKIQVVSEELIAFQFYDSPEPPPANPAPATIVVPRKRRVNLRQPVVRRTYEKVGV